MKGKNEENTTGFVSYKGERDLNHMTDKNLNQLPPGMDVESQQNAEIHELPFKTITPSGYAE